MITLANVDTTPISKRRGLSLNRGSYDDTKTTSRSRALSKKDAAASIDKSMHFADAQLSTGGDTDGATTRDKDHETRAAMVKQALMSPKKKHMIRDRTPTNATIDSSFGE